MKWSYPTWVFRCIRCHVWMDHAVLLAEHGCAERVWREHQSGRRDA